jgi:hypothetical protein
MSRDGATMGLVRQGRSQRANGRFRLRVDEGDREGGRPEGHTNHCSWLWQRVRRIGAPSVGGSVLALYPRVSPVAPCTPWDRRHLQRTDEHRSRDRDPSSPVDGAQAAAGETTSSPSRPVVHGRDQDAASSTVVLFRGQPADASSVAPGARAKEVELSADVRRGKAATTVRPLLLRAKGSNSLRSAVETLGVDKRVLNRAGGVEARRGTPPG